MKILLVSHNFPPHGNAGTETYTADLGSGLARRGHEVHVFTAAKDIARPHLSHHVRDHHGLHVHEIFNNLHYEDFRETWDHPGVDRIFAELCRTTSPDVVHFQHLMYLSTGCIEIAHRAAPVLFTLHDYWLQCPRFGQRVHADGGVCHTIDFERCGTCLASFKYAQSPTERGLGSLIAKIQAGTGLDLGPLARSSRAALSGKSHGSVIPDRSKAREMSLAAGKRTRAIQERVLSHVDLFLAPSRFLRERFVGEWRIPPEKIEHLRFGVDLAAFGALPRRRSEKASVAFIGTLIPIKGPHLLLEAWSKLALDVRRGADLAIYGPSEHEPEYQRLLARLARDCGARLGGRLERGDVASVLARTDLLVVPSLWYENAPLVIHEALASRTPLLVSDLGGMAELVEPGESGYRFRMGDVDDLARTLGGLLVHRERLEALYARPIELPRVGDHLDAIEARYRALVQSKSSRGRG